MKKTFAAFAAALMLFGTAFGFTACGSVGEHEHTWNEGEITVQPTCTQEGVKTFTCTVEGCNETKTEPVGKAEHSYDGGVITQEATCYEAGIKTFTCGACGNKYTESVGKIAHTWDGGKLSVIPTLGSAGETLFTCTVCKDTRRDPAAPRADFGEQFYTSLPADSEWKYGYTESLENFGFVQITATDEEEPEVWKAEGVEISADRIFSAGHAVIAYTLSRDTDLNLTAAFTGAEENTRIGAKLFIDNPGESVTVSKEEKDWTFVTEEKISVSAGSCLYFVFTNNGEGKPEGSLKVTLISDCIHIWDDGEVTTGPTCHSDGEKTFTCEKCGETHTEAVTERPRHDFSGAWLIGTEGHFHKCTNCNATDTPVQHVYNTENEEKRIEATCHSDGKKYMLCECGDETEIAITERPQHDFSGEWQIGADGHFHKCKNCEEVDNKIAHIYNRENEEKRVDATCHSDGKKYMLCECGDETEVAITERPRHDFSGEWVAGDEGHYHICKNADCGETDAPVNHNWEDVEVIKPATNTEAGEMKIKCSVCAHESTRVIPALNHKKGTELKFDEDGGTHWYACSEHTDCGVKFEEKQHTFDIELPDGGKAATCKEDGYSVWKCECGATETRIISKDTVAHTYDMFETAGESGHFEICSVCGNKPEAVKDHEWKIEVTTEPTATSHGVETHTCEKCGESKTENIHLTADFAKEFTAEEQTGAWSYGYVDYEWENETFEFHKSESFENDVWEAENIEIKAGWINAGGMAAIAYTVSEDAFIKATINFIGGTEGTRLALRIGVKNREGVLYSVPAFMADTESNRLDIEQTYEFKAGDTVYFIFSNNTKEEGCYPNGALNIALTAHYIGDWKTDSVSGMHYKECDVCNERFFEYASFREDFTTENQDGAWSYGKMDSPWSDDRNFVAATKTDDAWKADGVEIKAGWINANGETTVGYTAQIAMSAKINVNFLGSGDNTLLAIRIYSVNSEGKLSEIGFNNTKNEDGRQIVEIEHIFAAEDTVYIMFSNENWQDSTGTANPNGELDITITKTA